MDVACDEARLVRKAKPWVLPVAPHTTQAMVSPGETLKLTKFTDAQQAPVNSAPGAQRLTIQYTLTGKGALQLTFQLVKEGDDWKIDAITVP